jgi:hypothetical protein
LHGDESGPRVIAPSCSQSTDQFTSNELISLATKEVTPAGTLIGGGAVAGHAAF